MESTKKTAPGPDDATRTSRGEGDGEIRLSGMVLEVNDLDEQTSFQT